jgi:diketogulonate reductase-like aldo/keto reductase
VHLPFVSLGTGSGLKNVNVTYATMLWLGAGGTGIDTAYNYRWMPVQKHIAKGIAAAASRVKLPRQRERHVNDLGADVFLITKIPCSTYDEAKRHIESNLKDLQVSAVDITLIHFRKSGCSLGGTWRALEEAKAAGQTRKIGVSNFRVKDFAELKTTATMWPPALTQNSLSVGYHDDATIKYCAENRIAYMAFSPLCGGFNGSSCTHGSVLKVPEVISIAAARNRSPAAIALKWVVQQGHPLATATANQDHMRDDMDLWSWGDLSDAEMATLSAVRAVWPSKHLSSAG